MPLCRSFPINQTSHKSQICVIGSGPAGSIAAVALAEKGADVLVLEGGGDLPDYALEDIADRVSVTGETGLSFGFSRQVGGATNLWAGRLAPLEDIDFQKRDWVDHSGWPIGREDIQPYYDKAATLLGLLDRNQFTTPVMPASMEKLNGVQLKRFFWAQKPFHAGDYLQEKITILPNLKLITGIKVTHLSCDSTGTRIAAADAMQGDMPLRIEADHFIIAAGGLETPRLLLHSFKPDGRVVGNDNDNVGRYFSTHPKADMAVLHLNKRVSTAEPLYIDTAVGERTERHGLGFSAETQKRERLLNHYVQLSPLLEFQATKLFEKIKGAGALKSKFIDRNRLMRGLLPFIGLTVYELISRMAGLQRKTRLFMLRGFLDQYPSPDNRITLSNSVDARGMKKVNIDWTFTARDKDSVLSFFKVMDKHVRAAGMGHIEFSAMEKMDDWPLTGIHSHFMGTTRMGHDPKTSVTNADARVHDMENLFVSGPSLFTTYGYANPVLTISALALRLADHISRKL